MNCIVFKAINCIVLRVINCIVLKTMNFICIQSNKLLCVQDNNLHCIPNSKSVVGGLWCLTPFSTIYELYRGGQFYSWRTPQTCRKHWQTLYRIMLYRVHIAMSGIRTRNISFYIIRNNKCDMFIAKNCNMLIPWNIMCSEQYILLYSEKYIELRSEQ